MSFALSVLLAMAPEASASCYDTATYAAARTELAELPTERERDELTDRSLQVAIDELEIALVLFVATEGTSCRTADPAKREVEDTTNLVASLSAGWSCTCSDALPIGGHTCESCDYHDRWGCQCWYKKNPDSEPV